MYSLKKVADTIVQLFASKLTELKPQAVIMVSEAQTGYRYDSPLNAHMPDGVGVAFQEAIGISPILPARNFFFYKDVFVTNEGVILKNFKISTHSLTFIDKKYQYQNSFLLRQWIGQEIVIIRDELIIIAHNSNSVANYYHWLIEVCSKLMLLDPEYKKYPVIVSAPGPSYVTEIAKLLGYDKLLPLNENQLLKAKQVLLIERTSEIKDNTSNCYDTHQDPQLIHLLRKEIMFNLNISIIKPFRLLYISRAKQGSRRVINEPEVVLLLSRYGFEVVYFENVTFAQQVELVSEAAIIIGAHGANLTNIIFMHPNTVVIELVNKIDNNSVFFRLASYINLLYYRLLCEPQEGAPNETADIQLNLKSLQSILKNVIPID